jgi:hypothetical protein
VTRKESNFVNVQVHTQHKEEQEHDGGMSAKMGMLMATVWRCVFIFFQWQDFWVPISIHCPQQHSTFATPNQTVSLEATGTVSSPSIN